MDVSCIMLACNLMTPISLGSVFNYDDLEGDGIITDSHITILYAKDKFIDKEKAISEIGEKLIQYLEDLILSDTVFKVSDLFTLSLFSNESDHVILRLDNRTELYAKLNRLNGELSRKEGVVSEFDEYKPHITLATLKKGEGEKYLENNLLHEIIDKSEVQLEDFIISYLVNEENNEYKVYDLTHNKSVDRIFRIRELKKELQDLKED